MGGVYVVSDGLPVVLDDRLWSLDPATMSPWSPTAYVGATTLDPERVWKAERSIRTVVGFLARNIAQVPMHAFKLAANGDRDRLDRAAPLSRLLRRPSKVDTATSWVRHMVIDVCLWDRYAAWIQGDGAGLELVRLPPRSWAFKRDRLRRPTAIVIATADGNVVERPLSEFMWLDGYPVEGATPLAALCALIEEESESSAYRVQLLRKGGRFGHWIERPADAADWSTAAKTNFKAGWQAFASGGGREGETPILEDGMKLHEVEHGITPETAQALETRKFSNAEVAAAFHVPPMFVGLLDNANYSNVGPFREILYGDTLGPWFVELQQAFNDRVLPHPAIAADPDTEFVEFAVAEKLRMAFEEQARIFQTTTGGPIMTRNEARRRLNLPAIDGADDLIVPLNVLTGGQASPTDSGSQNQR